MQDVGQGAGELAAAGLVGHLGAQLGRFDVDRVDVGRGGELGADAIKDAAAVGRELDLAQVLLLGQRAV